MKETGTSKESDLLLICKSKLNVIRLEKNITALSPYMKR